MDHQKKAKLEKIGMAPSKFGGVWYCQRTYHGTEAEAVESAWAHLPEHAVDLQWRADYYSELAAKVRGVIDG